MRILGIIMIALGIIWGFVAFNMKTTVHTGGNTIGSGEFSIHIPESDVNNLGLMDSRRNHLLVGSSIAVVGFLLFGFGTLVRSQTEHFVGNDGLRACPFCAEMIQKAAVKCRYCGSEIEGAANQSFYVKPNSIWDDIKNAKPVARVAFAMLIVMAVVALGWLGYAFLDLRRTQADLSERAAAAQKVMDETSPEAKRLWESFRR